VSSEQLAISGEIGVGVWEINKEILQKHYAGLLEDITSDGGEDSESKVERAVSGEPIVSVNGVNVHSTRDPLKEGVRLVEAAVAGNGGVVVILGFGVGYSSLAASELGRTIIIVEKYKKLLLQALELRDFSELLTGNKVIFVLGGTGEGIVNALSVAGEISGEEKEKVVIVRNRALYGIDEQWYGAVEERIRTWEVRDKVNVATFNRFGKRWVRNLSRNMGAIRDCPGVWWFERVGSREWGVGRGEQRAICNGALPVFLAGAGPGLDMVRPFLREIYERCVIVAVDTNLRFFVDSGIQPDFVLVVDPQFWNSRHLDRCVCGKTVLIAESAVFPPVLRLEFDSVFLCGSLFPLGSFIEERVDPKGKLGAGGSVATTAWDFARLLGGDEIWIAGLDLSFPGFKTHFRGARFEESAVSQADRFKPVETWLVKALRDGQPFKAPSASGGQVLTDRRLSLYAAWFENRFRTFSKTKNYSLSKEGLAIGGLEYAGLEKLLELPQRRGEINRRLEEVFSGIEKGFNAPGEKEQRAQKYEKAVSILIRGLESVMKAAEEGAKIAERALNSNLSPEQQQKILKNLDYITSRISDSEVKEVAGFLFSEFEDENTDSGEKNPFRSYLKNTFKMFAALSQTIQFNLKNINQ
jgi:hypothetical protein